MTEKRRALSIELSADEIHEAFVAYLKKKRPTEYKLSKGKESTLFFTVRKGKLDTAGFEVWSEP